MSIESGLSGIDIRPVDEASFSQVHPEGAGVTRRKRPSGFACFFSSSHRRKRDGRAVTRQPEGRGPSLHRGGANASDDPRRVLVLRYDSPATPPPGVGLAGALGQRARGRARARLADVLSDLGLGS